MNGVQRPNVLLGQLYVRRVFVTLVGNLRRKQRLYSAVREMMPYPWGTGRAVLEWLWEHPQPSPTLGPGGQHVLHKGWQPEPTGSLIT